MAKIPPPRNLQVFFYIFLPVLYLKVLGVAFFRTSGRKVRINPAIFEKKNDV